jgi:hypothetical protein
LERRFRARVSAIMLCLILCSVFALAIYVQSTKGSETCYTPYPINDNVILLLPPGVSIQSAAAMQIFTPVPPPSPTPSIVPSLAGATPATTASVSSSSYFVAVWDIKVVPSTFSQPILVKIYASSPVGQMFQTEFILGDVNGDGKVNLADLFLMLKALGSSLGCLRWNPFCDLNNDGKVNLKDLCILLQNFGKTSAWTWTDITYNSGTDAVGYYVVGATDHFSGFGVH